jgi:Flp pilus assembly protein TadG
MENPMKKKIVSFALRALNDQRGQTLPIAAVIMVLLLGFAGLVTDVGRAYVVRAQLQNSASAAALAGAGLVYTAQSQTVNTTTEAKLYSAGRGDENAYSGLTVSTTVTTKCLNSLMGPGETCGAGSFPNAVQVTNVTSVPTLFMALFRVPKLTVGATATASIAGLANRWNIAVIVDATGSMADMDTNCGGVSEFQCALNGVQDLLAATNPCPQRSSTCSPGPANARVALFTFPNIETSPTNYLPIANACANTGYSGPGLPYQVTTLPKKNAASYTPIAYREWNNTYTWSASYEVTWGASDADANGYVSDYYQPTNKTTGGLNPNSSIIKAVGYGGSGRGGKTGCLPMSPAGIAINGAVGKPTAHSIVNTVDVGEGITDYAPVIYAAQASLVAEQNLHPGSRSAIVLLSDGGANTQWIYFPQGSLRQTPTVNQPAPSTLAPGSSGYDTLNSTPNKHALVAYQLSTPNQEAIGSISGIYPDFFDECQQAIVAGQEATAAGTTVFAVAYGSGTGGRSGCGSGGAHADDYNDVTLVATGKNATFTLGALTPCVTMENIASSLETFYSDFNQSGSRSACVDSGHPEVQLNDIFTAIAAKFTTPRLIPNNAT